LPEKPEILAPEQRYMLCDRGETERIPTNEATLERVAVWFFFGAFQPGGLVGAIDVIFGS